MIILVIFFRNKPPTPPSAPKLEKKAPFMQSLKLLFTNRNMILMIFVFAGIVGVFNALGTVVGEFATRYGFTNV
jgi:Na+/melibiose symporter-like transporter